MNSSYRRAVCEFMAELGYVITQKYLQQAYSGHFEGSDPAG